MNNGALFFDQEATLTFEKIASAVKLSDNPENWQKEMASEIYKQCPYLSDYAVNVIVNRVEEKRGYAFGAAEVTTKAEIPSKHQKMVRIPLLVKDRSLQPIDIFIDSNTGGSFPLNERRLRQMLFNTDTFEMTKRKGPDPSIADELRPPMGKTASLLDAIAHTLDNKDVQEFCDYIQSDPQIKLAAALNGEFVDMALKIAKSPRSSVEKTAEALVEGIKPTAVQFEKLADGNFAVRWANRNAFIIKEAKASPKEAVGMAGSEDMKGMTPGDTLTVSTEPAKLQSLMQPSVIKIQHSGLYEVKKDDGEPVVGWVLPIIDFDMQPLEMFLFTDGHDTYGVQDDIAGQPLGHDPELPEGEPMGNGCYYFIDGNGQARALLPMSIQNQATNPDGTPTLMAETMFGEEVTLVPVPELKTIEKMGEDVYGIPADLKWLPLPKDPVHLMKYTLDVQSQDAAAAAPGKVDVSSTGNGEVSLDGPPVERISKEARHFIKEAQAEFLLVTMGSHPVDAQEMIKAAHKYGKMKMAGLRPITPLADLHREMVKKAAITLSNFPYGLRTNLIKEAIALEDSETADKILSLNFINPENVSTFSSYLPQLDSCVRKLAEMLMAARLGMHEFDEHAIERAMKHLERVIQGLRALQQKDMV